MHFWIFGSGSFIVSFSMDSSLNVLHCGIRYVISRDYGSFRLASYTEQFA